MHKPGFSAYLCIIGGNGDALPIYIYGLWSGAVVESNAGNFLHYCLRVFVQPGNLIMRL